MNVKKAISTGIVGFPMLMYLLFFVIRGEEGINLFSAVVITSFVMFLFIKMVYTGKVYKYRSIFFIAAALLFFPSFIAHLVSARGQLALTETNVLNNEVPFCHMVIPFTIIPYAFTETMIFPAKLINSYTSIYAMLVIWLMSTLILGRGWCSWICFFGGWDELFSKAGKKKIIKTDSNRGYARYLNFTILIFAALITLKTLSVAYCEWFCPLKLVTEHGDANSFLGFLQFIAMVLLFFGLLVVLPFLTKKRIQCGTYCPFGAFQSFTNKISPFRVLIDNKKCIDCNKCIKVCPTFSLTKESLFKGKTCITCTLCGKCIDECPKNAVSYKFSFFRKQLEKDGVLYNVFSPKTLVVFAGLLLGTIISSGFMNHSLSMFIRFLGGM